MSIGGQETQIFLSRGTWLARFLRLDKWERRVLRTDILHDVGKHEFHVEGAVAQQVQRRIEEGEQPEHDEPQVGDGGIGDELLHVLLDHRDHRPVHDADDREEDDPPGASPVERKEERELERDDPEEEACDQDERRLRQLRRHEVPVRQHHRGLKMRGCLQMQGGARLRLLGGGFQHECGLVMLTAQQMCAAL